MPLMIQKIGSHTKSAKIISLPENKTNISMSSLRHQDRQDIRLPRMAEQDRTISPKALQTKVSFCRTVQVASGNVFLLHSPDPKLQNTYASFAGTARQAVGVNSGVIRRHNPHNPDNGQGYAMVESDTQCLTGNAFSVSNSRFHHHHRCVPGGMGRPSSGSLSGKWTTSEKRMHINLLELKAMALALFSFLPKIAGLPILIRTDNITCMHYLNKEGGTKSTALSHQAQTIWKWALQNNVTECRTCSRSLQFAGGHFEQTNIQLAQLGTQFPGSTEYFPSLGHATSQSICNQDKQEMSLLCKLASAERVVGKCLFDRMVGNIYLRSPPPIPLIPRVLRRMKREPCRLILIVPKWLRQFWYTELVLLLEQPHIPLTSIPMLLSMNRGQVQVLHPNPTSLNLSAWLLTTMSSKP